MIKKVPIFCFALVFAWSLSAEAVIPFGAILSSIGKEALKLAAVETTKTVVEHYLSLFNKNKTVAKQYGSPKLRGGEPTKDGNRNWVLSPRGNLTKSDIQKIAEALKSLDGDRKQQIVTRINNEDQVITSDQEGVVTQATNIRGDNNSVIGSGGDYVAHDKIEVQGDLIKGDKNVFPPAESQKLQNTVCGKDVPVQDCPLKIWAYSWHMFHREGTVVDGVTWGALDSDVRVVLRNQGLSRIQNIVSKIVTDTHMRKVVQVSAIPGLIVSPNLGPISDVSVTINCEDGSQGEMGGSFGGSGAKDFLSPEVGVQSSELLGTGEIKLVIACVALNAVINGEPPKTLFAPRRPPKWLRIEGTYETNDAASHRRWHFNQTFQLTEPSQLKAK